MPHSQLRPIHLRRRLGLASAVPWLALALVLTAGCSRAEYRAKFVDAPVLAGDVTAPLPDIRSSVLVLEDGELICH